ncbi:hypothetical protein J560_4492, partial [Acinetobacter baumannii 855125]
MIASTVGSTPCVEFGITPLIAVDIVWATLRIDDWFWGSLGF